MSPAIGQQRAEFNPCWLCCGCNCTEAGFLRVHLPSDTFATAGYSHLTPDLVTVGRSAKGSATPHPSNKIHSISGTPVFQQIMVFTEF
jgi:hypothetical protein